MIQVGTPRLRELTEFSYLVAALLYSSTSIVFSPLKRVVGLVGGNAPQAASSRRGRSAALREMPKKERVPQDPLPEDGIGSQSSSRGPHHCSWVWRMRLQCKVASAYIIMLCCFFCFSVYRAALWTWSRIRCRRKVPPALVVERTPTKAVRVSGLERLKDLEEGSGLKGAGRSSKHRRNDSAGSMMSFDEEELGQVRAKILASRTDSQHKRHCDCSSELQAVPSPKLPQVSQWVKDVLEELSEVSSRTDEKRSNERRNTSPDSTIPASSQTDLSADSTPPPAGMLPSARAPSADAPRSVAPAEDVEQRAGVTAPPEVPRTPMHDLARLWTAVLVRGGRGEGDAGEGDTRSGDEVRVEELLSALATSSEAVSERLGSIMAPAAKNDAKNVEMVRREWHARGRPQMLSELLRAELGAGVHRRGSAGYVLREPSVAMAIVWLRRAFAFQAAILEGVVSRPDAPLGVVVSAAYGAELEPHHSWMLKSTMKVALSAVPSRDDFVRRLCAEAARGRSDAEATQMLYDDLRELVQLQRRVLKAVAAPLVALGLDPSAAG